MLKLIQIWDRLWFTEASLLRLAAFRIIIVLIAGWEFCQYFDTYVLEGQGRPEAPLIYREYQPIYLLYVLGIEPPSTAVASTVLWTLGVALIMALLGICTRVSLTVVTILSIYLYGTMYSFGQAHHDKIFLAFALLVLPFTPAGCRLSVDHWLGGRSSNQEQRTFAAWPILFMQITIAISYCAAGVTKLLTGGAAWMNGYTLQGVFLAGGTPLSSLGGQNVQAAAILSIGTVLMQATFPLCLFVRQLRWIYCPAIVGFHLGNWMMVGTNNQIGMWGVMLAAFIPLDRLLSRFGIGDQQDGSVKSRAL